MEPRSSIEDDFSPSKSYGWPRSGTPEFHPPIAQSFSFSISHIWRSNNNMLRWITDVPEVHHDKPMEPSEFRGEKHALSHEEMQTGHDGGGHRNKRVKIHQAPACQGAGKQRRRDRIFQATRKVARSVSDGFHRIISPFRHPAQPEKSPTSSPTSPGLGIPISPIKRQRLRFVFVGDSNCGKSCMLMRFYRDLFTDSWNPTTFELYDRPMQVDGQEYDLELWDTSGVIELHQLERLSYLMWDAVFLCFSVNSDKKFAHAQTKWIKEIRTYCRGVPLFLLGLKKDTRVGSGIWAPLFPNWEPRIGATEGAMAANHIDAVKYMECSAKTGDGVDRIFEEGVRLVQTIQAGDQAMRREKMQGLTLERVLCF